MPVKKNGVINSVESVDCKKKAAEYLKQNLRIRPEDICMELIAGAVDPFVSFEEKKIVAKVVAPFYKKWGLFGPYGDAMMVFCISEHLKINYYMTLIGNIQFPLPSMAADIVPFIWDQKLNSFFVGIVRGKEPGKGKPALIGGHRDVKGAYFQTAIEALLHESEDEAALKILPPAGVTAYKERPGLSRQKVVVQIGDEKMKTVLTYVGDFRTCKEELIAHLDETRVHETSVYTFTALCKKVLSEEILADMLKAGDDAAEIFVWDTRKGTPCFGLKHHKKIYEKACEKRVG